MNLKNAPLCGHDTGTGLKLSATSQQRRSSLPGTLHNSCSTFGDDYGHASVPRVARGAPLQEPPHQLSLVIMKSGLSSKLL